MAKVTIAVPFHWMENWPFFLNRCLESIEKQSFKDYEVVLIKHSNMPITSNRVIESAKGEIIKILYLDDYFARADSLQEIVDNFKGGWLAVGCIHDNGIGLMNYHKPSYEGIPQGQNTIGSPSVIAFENKDPELFNVHMSWLLDVHLYRRLYERYGEPTIVNSANVAIGVGKHQMTHILTDKEKEEEKKYL